MGRQFVRPKIGNREEHLGKSHEKPKETWETVRETW